MNSEHLRTGLQHVRAELERLQGVEQRYETLADALACLPLRFVERELVEALPRGTEARHAIWEAWGYGRDKEQE